MHHSNAVGSILNLGAQHFNGTFYEAKCPEGGPPRINRRTFSFWEVQLK